jgi:hypothetical protein
VSIDMKAVQNHISLSHDETGFNRNWVPNVNVSSVGIPVIILLVNILLNALERLE